MTWKIPLFKMYWDKDDVKGVTEAIKVGMCWAIGPNIEKFEKMICGYNGMEHCVVFNSGTSALHAALLAHDIKKGDEVIVPSFTFIATANAPLFVGAKPVFADIEEKTFGLDPEDVNEKITKKTKAIIPIHYAGCPCKIRELKEISEDHKLLLIEDAAESFGAKIGGKMVGSFGDSAILSFCQNKIITTGDGGGVVTNSKEIYERLKLIRSHGRLDTQNYFSSTEYMDYVALGYNFRMSNITAALGIAQIKKVDKIIRMRREKAGYITKKLSGIKEVIPPNPPKNYSHVYQMYTIRIKKGKKTRDGLMKHLAKKGIMTKVYFDPVHLTHFYRKKLGYRCKLSVTERLSKQVLTLPMYPALTKNEINYITDNIDTFFKG